jgi:hypothetical protein
MAILKPYTFTAGTKARASEVNANFDALYTEVNSLESRIIDYESQIQDLQNTKADINGSYLNRFAVANPVTNYDAVNKQHLQNATANSITYINGLGITKVGDATISVDAGSCYDSTDTQLLVLENSLEKQNTTQAASSIYYVYILSTTGGEDILIFPEPSLPSEYSYHRRIGSYTTDSDNKILQINVEQLSQYSSSSTFFAQTSKDITNLVTPDYSAGYSIGDGWTAVTDGLCFFQGIPDGGSYVTIGGVSFQVSFDTGDGQSHGALSMIVGKGTVVNGFSRIARASFYPFKGAK